MTKTKLKMNSKFFLISELKYLTDNFTTFKS